MRSEAGLFKGLLPSSPYLRMWVGLLLAGLFLRLAVVAVFHPPLVSDDREYVGLAHALAQGEGFQIDGHQTAYRLPAYPLLIAASFRVFGSDLLPLKLLQLVFDLCSCLLVFGLGKRLASEHTGMLAMGITILFPMQILYVPMLMTETLYTFLLLSIVWLSLEHQRESHEFRTDVAVGLFVGLGTLLRTTTLLLPILVFAHRWIAGTGMKSNVRRFLVVGFIAALVVSPWIERNYRTFNRVSLTSNSGVNFWMGNHPGASGSYSFPLVNNPLRNVEQEFERSDLGFQLAWKFIRQSPVDWLKVEVRKYAHYIGFDYWIMGLLEHQPRWATYPHAADVFREMSWWNYVAVNLPFAIILLLATFGFAFVRNEDRLALFLPLIVVVGWLAVHLAVYGGARYRFPIQPLLILGSAYGVQLLRSRSWKAAPLRTTVCVFLTASYVGSWGVALWMIR